MKKRKTVRKPVLALLIALALLLAAAAAYAATQKGEVSVTNKLQTGSVNINLTAYERTEDGEREARPGEAVVANQKLSYIPRITCLRETCYVRLTLRIKMDQTIQTPLSADDIYDLGEGWIQKGSAFYYTKPLKNGEATDAFSGIHIPKEWTNEDSSSFQVYLTADAIQAPNFTPDFKADQPWGAVEIEEAKKTDTVDYRSVKRVRDVHTLTYTGNQAFEVPTTDFFSNFSHMEPGDTFEDSVQLKNAADNNILLEFKSAAKQDVLLQKIKLKILVGDKTVYNGNLQADKLSDWTALATIPKNEVKKLRYELTVPETLKNAFSAEADSVVWSFRATEVDQNGNPVQTGDEQSPLPFILLGIATIGILTILLTNKKKKGEKGEPHE